MSLGMELDEDFTERWLRQHELLYRSAQRALAEARALYAFVNETPGTSDLQRHQAQLRVQRAMRQLLDIRAAADQLEHSGEEGRADKR